MGTRRSTLRAEVLFTELARVVAAKGYRLEPGAAIAKLTFMYGALIDRPIESVYQVGNELFVLSLKDLAGFDRTHPGAGLFFEARVDSLSDLVTFVSRKDQTVTAHGFSNEELTDIRAVAAWPRHRSHRCVRGRPELRQLLGRL